MLELLEYFRAHGFRTWIVSGGGVEFIRPWSEHVYGIPPEQVIGSSIKTRFQIVDGKPVLMRLPEIDFINDGPGKPVGINRFIGRQPVFAAGNSDGDLEMLQRTTRAPGPGVGLLIHHTDGAGEDMPTTGNRRWDGSTKLWRRHHRQGGRWSILVPTGGRSFHFNDAATLLS
jgi:hypothetical protein